MFTEETLFLVVTSDHFAGNIDIWAGGGISFTSSICRIDTGGAAVVLHGVDPFGTKRKQLIQRKNTNGFCLFIYFFSPAD